MYSFTRKLQNMRGHRNIIVSNNIQYYNTKMQRFKIQNPNFGLYIFENSVFSNFSTPLLNVRCDNST